MAKNYETPNLSTERRKILKTIVNQSQDSGDHENGDYKPKERSTGAVLTLARDDLDLKIESRKKYIPGSRQILFEKAVLGTTSPRQAIKAFCQSCIGYEEISESIRDCKAHTCPLWSYRPYSKGRN